MSLEAFRAAPSFTIGSGPAAGVAAALHQLSLSDGIVLECGGTSSNVSVVKGGRTVLRTLRVMGRPTSIRSVDSWVVGAAGGSLGRVGRRKIEEAGPRSAHVAGLPYACFAAPERPRGRRARARRAARRRPRAVRRHRDARRPPPRAHRDVRGARARPRRRRRAGRRRRAAARSPADRSPQAAERARAAALAAFAPLAARMKRTPEEAARACSTARSTRSPTPSPTPRARTTSARTCRSSRSAGRAPRSRPRSPAASAARTCAPSTPRSSRRSAPRCRSCAARSPATRTAAGDAVALAREAERACVDAGAAPQTVRVETFFEARDGLLRAVATGAVALESGAASREPVDEPAQLRAAAGALGMARGRPAGRRPQRLLPRVLPERRGRRRGGRRPRLGRAGRERQARDRRRPGALLERLTAAVDDGAVNLGVATLLPRVAIVCGPHLVDLSDARRAEDIARGRARRPRRPRRNRRRRDLVVT